MLAVLVLTPAALAVCSGTAHACSSHNGDQSACTSAGCSYNSNNNRCQSTHNTCDSYSTQSTCESHSCTWTEDNNGGGGGGDTGGNDTGTGGSGGSTTTTTIDGGTIIPVDIFFEQPLEGDIVKRGPVTLVVRALNGGVLDNSIAVNAYSTLFSNMPLIGGHNGRTGYYGTTFTIDEKDAAGKHTIRVTAEKEAYDEQQISITVDPTITINATINGTFEKGTRIYIEGSATYFDGSPVTSTPVDLVISAGEQTIVNTQVNITRFGTLKEDYLISFADPEGDWTISMTATDSYGNTGTYVYEDAVTTPEGVAFYTVTFLSPLKNGEFSRGDAIPVTVQVSEEETLITDAIVQLRQSDGSLTQLREVEEGTYTGEYDVGLSDELGTLQISVQATTNVNNITRAGGNSIPVIVRAATINTVLLKPTSTEFFTGQRIIFEGRATYDNDLPVENAEAKVQFGNKTITLRETEPGIYKGDYVVLPEDLEVKTMVLSVVDAFGSVAKGQSEAISIEPIGEYELQARLFYYNYVRPFWYAYAGGLVLFLLITYPLWHGMHMRRQLKKTKRKETEILDMEKDIQRKYFKKHNISRENYDALMLKYRERAEELEEIERKLDNKIHKKKATKNKKKKAAKAKKVEKKSAKKTIKKKTVRKSATKK